MKNRANRNVLKNSKENSRTTTTEEETILILWMVEAKDLTKIKTRISQRILVVKIRRTTRIIKTRRIKNLWKQLLLQKLNQLKIQLRQFSFHQHFP